MVSQLEVLQHKIHMYLTIHTCPDPISQSGCVCIGINWIELNGGLRWQGHCCENQVIHYLLCPQSQPKGLYRSLTWVFCIKYVRTESTKLTSMAIIMEINYHNHCGNGDLDGRCHDPLHSHRTRDSYIVPTGELWFFSWNHNHDTLGLLPE